MAKNSTNLLLLLGAGAIGLYWYFNMGGKATVNNLFSGYAYPNFYTYGHPFYYMHMDAPEVRNNYGFGQVNVPRISNALAAKQIDTGNYQLTTVNPQYDFNHIYSYIQEEY